MPLGWIEGPWDFPQTNPRPTASGLPSENPSGLQTSPRAKIHLTTPSACQQIVLIAALVRVKMSGSNPVMSIEKPWFVSICIGICASVLFMWWAGILAVLRAVFVQNQSIQFMRQLWGISSGCILVI